MAPHSDWRSGVRSRFFSWKYRQQVCSLRACCCRTPINADCTGSEALSFQPNRQPSVGARFGLNYTSKLGGAKVGLPREDGNPAYVCPVPIAPFE